MTTRPDDHDALTRLILGELQGDERERLEERFLAEPDLLDRAAAVEAELADAHVRGELPPARRQAWEKRVAVSGRLQERAAFAQALAARLDAARPRRPAPRGLFAWLARAPVRRPALAAALIVAVAWLGWELRPGREERAVAEAERGPQPPAPRAAEPPREPAPGSTVAPAQAPLRESAVAILALGIGSARAGQEPPRLAPGDDVETVRLEIDLEAVEVYRRLRAVVRSESGAFVVRRAGLAPRPARGLGTVAVNVPRRLLPPGAYVVTIEGLPAAGAWETAAVREFRVVRR
jgi:hypothetical protein